MTAPPEDEKPGYGRPPKRTKWKKGQSGNPNRHYAARDRSTVAMIETFFSKPVEVTLGGEAKRVSTLEAIIRLISQKVLSGDRRAIAAQMKYEEFLARFRERKVRIVFVDNEYTQAVAAEPQKREKTDE